ncbi:hypothetical protein MAA_03373 [Metarhizium robertsii ARSEF 23]|uniref:Uncharacterized protein n=1 Tax=Metarhizium robertsii (strain ARSEF 23 / ATCC MYA-3075) TaxID=655844 RepID=E9ETM4_METRA|nr:uncharacterized protein MAA_03373 [Metarhizium robertsii ARSEF 23]EFZ00777.1 hypothetical protein MAA_03373 [Metarhizium robertsii ARSEF 23]
MASSGSVRRALVVVGKVSKGQVLNANAKLGSNWLSALDIAEQTAQADYPNITGMEIAGALAHQSHQVQSHSNVLSVKFFEGEDRVISGHVHMNGRVDYSRERLRSGQKERWKPTRDQVDQNSWTVYDPEKKKHRKVFQEQGWLYIEIGGVKVWF